MCFLLLIGHNRIWQLSIDDETGSSADTLLLKNAIKTRMSHFCHKCILGRSKLRVQILPFIPADLQRSKKIGLTVYAVKSFDAKVSGI